MKSTLMKMLVGVGIAASIAVVSAPAQACGSCYSSCKPVCVSTCAHCGKAYAHNGCGYVRYKGKCCGFDGYQGRPVRYVGGEYVYVRHCSPGYWVHHGKKWHRPCCS